jgi:hypothetical protein
MNRLFFLFLIFCCFNSVAQKAPVAKPAAISQLASATDKACFDEIVARVNGQPLYLKEVLEYTLAREKNLVLVRPEDTPQVAIGDLRRRELERCILKRLFALEAHADESVQASTEEIQTEFQKLTKRFGDEESVERFYHLPKENILDLLAMNIAFRRLQQKHVMDRIEITPKMKEEYYAYHLKDKFTIPPQVAVRGLFRFADDEVEMASEEMKIQTIRQELKEALTGIEDKPERLRVFAGFTRVYSEHQPTRFSGGYWYIYGGHNIQKKFWNFEDAAFETSENRLSEVVRLDDGYCLFIVDTKRPERVKTYAESEFDIEKMLQEELMNKYREEWFDSLREKYGVEVNEEALTCGIPEADKAESES